MRSALLGSDSNSLKKSSSASVSSTVESILSASLE
jgi:hypothetical protein